MLDPLVEWLRDFKPGHSLVSAVAHRDVFGDIGWILPLTTLFWYHLGCMDLRLHSVGLPQLLLAVEALWQVPEFSVTLRQVTGIYRWYKLRQRQPSLVIGVVRDREQCQSISQSVVTQKSHVFSLFTIFPVLYVQRRLCQNFLESSCA